MDNFLYALRNMPVNERLAFFDSLVQAAWETYGNVAELEALNLFPMEVNYRLADLGVNARTLGMVVGWTGARALQLQERDYVYEESLYWFVRTAKRSWIMCDAELNANLDYTSVFLEWFIRNLNAPYPTRGEKFLLAVVTNRSYKQVTDWFRNRRRNWQPPQADH